MLNIFKISKESLKKIAVLVTLASLVLMPFLVSAQVISSNRGNILRPINGGSSAGVSSLNTLTGAVTLSEGANITLTPSGNDIEISATGSGISTASNGLTATGADVELGGTLDENTAIDIDEFTFSVGGQINTDFSGGLYITDDFFGFGPIGSLMVASDPTGSNAIIQTGDVSAFNIGNTGESASMVAYLPGGAGITSYYLANSDGAFQTSTDGAGTTMQVFHTPGEFQVYGENSGGNSSGIIINPTIGVDLIFGTAGDLRLDSSAGNAGETIISQGIGVAPVWGTPTVDNVYTVDGTITGARELSGGGFTMSMIDFDGFTLSTGTGDITIAASQDNFLSAIRDVYISGDNSTNINSSGSTNINGGSIVIAPNNGDLTLSTTTTPSDMRINSGRDFFGEFEEQLILRNNAGDSYFSLDIPGDTYRFGDLTGAGLGLEMSIDNGTGIFSFLEKDNGQEMLRLHSTDFQYILGDVNDDKNSTKLDIHDDNQTVKLGGLNSGVWQYIDVINSTFTWGDVQGDVGGYQMNFHSDTGEFITAETNILNGRTATPTMEVTGAGTYTIGDNTAGLYYDPGSTQATTDITLPASPIDGQEITIYFGGTITAGAVSTVLTILPNTGHTIIGTLPTTATVDTVLNYKFRSSTNQWYQTL